MIKDLQNFHLLSSIKRESTTKHHSSIHRKLLTEQNTFAQTLWEKGVTARNAGQFDLAKDYYRQSEAYIDVYAANAVSQTYTVVYRQIATDCLWRIAEMADIFDNPYMWPKIWRANRRIIQNPDLIYPGQILAIPPK